jgi:hypothetical protein
MPCSRIAIAALIIQTTPQTAVERELVLHAETRSGRRTIKLKIKT